MNTDIECYIKQKYPWTRLPRAVKQILGDSQKEYEKMVIQFSVKNQLRYRGNLIRSVMKDERCYYEQLLQYSRDHLMLYPYHLSDFIVTGMRITPFQYYISIMQDLLEQEKSYDALPNFTAADCLRLLGIGRNQYIELMNQCRSSKKFFGVRRKPICELLPTKPVSTLQIEPWWLIHIGYVTEDDIKVISSGEKLIIDKIIDDDVQKAGNLDAKDVQGLYRKGLIYLDVPIEDEDYVIVPPLDDGFVMNRILGDYLETLLYKIFVSIDENTVVAELANILQVDLELVKNAVSIYCRLGFAKKKGQDDAIPMHVSWKKEFSKFQRVIEDNVEILSDVDDSDVKSSTDVSLSDCLELAPEVFSPLQKRIGFLFDSTLTAFLMMGNLSPGLKSHAVTMFEVGKLSDESLDTFLLELLKVADVGEGEARRYFDHALTLRDTIVFLRHNTNLVSDTSTGLGLDLLRCESLQNLEYETCSRLLNKNYSLLISMAPLTNEVRPVSSCTPPHLGPSIPEISSIWFKLFLYLITKSGPPSLLLTRGTRLHVLPKIFKDHERLLVTTWAHDPSTVQMSNALPILNDALCHSSVLVQGHGSVTDFYYIPFPMNDLSKTEKKGQTFDIMSNIQNHCAIQTLRNKLDLMHNCGYITMIKINHSGLEKPFKHAIFNLEESSDNNSKHSKNSADAEEYRDSEISKYSEAEPYRDDDWLLLDCCFGIPLFQETLNKTICERILDKKLCSKNSLENLAASNRKLCLQVLEFISKYQPVISGYDSGRDISFQPTFPGWDTELPLPTANLMFYEGKISIWD